MYSIDCRTYEDLVAGHVDGVLSDDERTAADQHLERCRRCSQLRRDVEGARDLVRGHTVGDIPSMPQLGYLTM